MGTFFFRPGTLNISGKTLVVETSVLIVGARLFTYFTRIIALLSLAKSNKEAVGLRAQLSM